MKHIGTHVSAAGGVSVSPKLAHARGGGAFAFFLTAPRTFTTKPLSPQEVDNFKEACNLLGFNRESALLPHGNYLINLASAKPDTFAKGQSLFHDELKRCNQLGIKHYNLHPGSATIGSREDAMSRVATAINEAHALIPDVVILLENMSGQGTTLGTTLDELQSILQLVHDQSRVGICIDTCHIFAAGQYDLRERKEYERLISDLEAKGLLQQVKAFHLNDSKKGFAEKLDRHENLGKGTIGSSAFTWLMQDPRLDEKIFITETPSTGQECIEELAQLIQWASG